MAGQTRILSPSHRRTIHAGRQERPPHPPSGLFRMTGFAKAGSTRCANGCGRFLQPYISRIFAIIVVNRSVSGQLCVDNIMLRRTFRLSPPTASAVADPLTLRQAQGPQAKGSDRLLPACCAPLGLSAVPTGQAGAGRRLPLKGGVMARCRLGGR